MSIQKSGRKQLSIEHNRSRFLLLILAILFLINGVAVFFQNDYRLVLLPLIFIFLSVLLAYLFSRTKKGNYHFFDKKHFYFEQKKQKKIIPLKSIVEINHPLIQMNEKTEKDIIFRNHLGKIEKVKIGVAGYRRNFKEFKKLVKRANPKALV